MQAEVTEVLTRAGHPMSAYDILAELRAATPKMAPTTVYRALSALTSRGCIHRLESLNAYMMCQCDDHNDVAILSICDDCGGVEETIAPELVESMTRVVGKSGFAPRRHVVEVHGTCAECGPEQTSS